MMMMMIMMMISATETKCNDRLSLSWGPITRRSFPREAFPRDDAQGYVSARESHRVETYPCASSRGNAHRGKDRRVIGPRPISLCMRRRRYITEKLKLVGKRRVRRSFAGWLRIRVQPRLVCGRHRHGHGQPLTLLLRVTEHDDSAAVNYTQLVSAPTDCGSTPLMDPERYLGNNVLCSVYKCRIMFYVPAPVGEGHYKLPSVVCLSVRLSVACLDITRERKGL